MFSVEHCLEVFHEKALSACGKRWKRLWLGALWMPAAALVKLSKAPVFRVFAPLP